MKAILHYVLLVGLPVLGVLGILHLGQDLKAPASVGGNWSITWHADEQCLTTNSTNLTISQSGPHLVIHLDGSGRLNLHGVLQELHIVAHTPGVKTAVLQATVDRQPEPDQMTGHFNLPDCAVPLAFTAIRQPAQQSSNKGH